ncbi:unnamed protein product [Prunus armeniaca]
MPLLSFSGDLVQPVGNISLPIAFGVAPSIMMTYDQFLIVDCPTTYNVIVRWTTLTRVKAHLSPHMLLMKFPTRNGTGVIRGDQLSAQRCLCPFFPFFYRSGVCRLWEGFVA